MFLFSQNLLHGSLTYRYSNRWSTLNITGFFLYLLGKEKKNGLGHNQHWFCLCFYWKNSQESLWRLPLKWLIELLEVLYQTGVWWGGQHFDLMNICMYVCNNYAFTQRQINQLLNNKWKHNQQTQWKAHRTLSGCRICKTVSNTYVFRLFYQDQKTQINAANLLKCKR